MPEVFNFDEAKRHQQQLRAMTLAAIAPIRELRQVIEDYHRDLRAELALGDA